MKSRIIISLLLSASSDVSVLDEECLHCDDIIASEVREREPGHQKTQQELYLEGYQHQQHNQGKLITD